MNINFRRVKPQLAQEASRCLVAGAGERWRADETLSWSVR